MPLNLEMKASFQSPARARRIARSIGARRAGILRQIDTYFKVKSGRLKIREINGREFELIYYRRVNAKANRYSDYTVVRLQDARPAKALFRSLFGVSAVVRKTRTLFLYKNARIHIDSVKGLGTFIEFEVVVTRGRKQARSIMTFLRNQFCIDPEALVGGSYGEMIRRN